MNPVLERLFAACEQSGISIAKDHRAEILSFADGIADPWLNDIVTAIANNLPSGGIKNVEWGPIKGSLLQSEPEIDAATNARISALFDSIVNAL